LSLGDLAAENFGDAVSLKNGRASQPLVLSLFPGIGLLDRAFEEEGFCVVRGPDVLWGGDARRFRGRRDRFDGVIGGPPCQPFSQLVHMVRANGFTSRHENLIPEFERIVAECQPAWFLMEEVPAAPLPCVSGYGVHAFVLNNRWCGGTQERKRRISFGSRAGQRLPVQLETLMPLEWDFAVTGDARTRPVAMLAGGKRKSGGRTSSLNRGGQSLDLATMCRLQGVPDAFLADSPFTISAKRQMLGNGVPLPMGRAIARAVKRAMGYEAGTLADGDAVGTSDARSSP